MNITVDHIAIASQHPEKTKSFFNLLKLSTHAEEVPTQQVRTTFYHTSPSSCAIELLEPLSENSPISKFLQKHSGIHHLALRVDRLSQLLTFLKQQGCRLINEEPQVGSHNSKIAFVHPESTGGVLVEFVERPSP
ncbi:MAG: methylmalonyl-CoA epimerase [Oligoflexales bacterium]